MTRSRAALLLSGWVLLSVVSNAQQPQPPAGRGRIGGNGIGAYPQRDPGDPAAIERGTNLYRTNCAFCHGQDIRGGDGGPSLLRSPVVLADQTGELIGPIVQAGRGTMPKFALSNDQVADLATFLHTFRVAGYDTSRNKPATIVVGNAAAGEKTFAARCASCHTGESDVRGIASRMEDPRALQQSWLMPGSQVGRGAPPPARARPPTITVTLPSGEKVTGALGRLDDFVASLTMTDGTYRSFRLDGKTKVEVDDPLRAHKELLRTYTDAEIHNITAYLATLK
jgi:cytochrome c oxidase cbb3-type subunit III